MEGMNMWKLFEKSQCTDWEYLKWLQEVGMITSSYSCSDCNVDMVLGKKNRCQDGSVWRCKRCKNTRTVRSGSWFEKSKMPLRKIVLITYMWAERFSQAQVMRECSISSKTVVDWFSFCREVCTTLMLRYHEPIGGEGKIVEIDESMFNKRKQNRGSKKKCQQWVFGGVEQGSNKCFLAKVDRRDAKTLVPLIMKNIRPGTTIYSDSWKAYDTLGRRGYRHLKVNHSITFKDGECCTNTIEGMWGLVKRMFPRCNRQKKQFDSYLAEFMFRRRFMQGKDSLASFVEQIVNLYKPSTEDTDAEDSETETAAGSDSE
ncbi:hypothetical protein FOCC_FOCC014679 [Frankliniella occidentalis]|uniref:Uncharacterized protein LOC113215766 n=1 Tax=Frankliniella occidentalis TaxID=133901 RepID=A0A6J1THK4_FRAOC|nr:uncharacterized protein LOC113215766 [Frankliniella occidentalis]KAE8739811.1 hypothetical protein FOCC_FOCC014679 [Frankliniella occidentalis]